MLVKGKRMSIGIFAVLLFIWLFNIGPAWAAGSQDNSTAAFTDVAAGDPNLVFIKYLSGKDIMKGYPDGSFKPQEGLTRAQASVVLVKAANLALEPNAASPFKDLDSGHWARPYVAAAVKAGYISGFPDGTFRPDAKITRAQGIALIMKLSTQKYGAQLPELKDMDQSHWAAQDMAVALSAKMIGLSSDGSRVYPDEELKRDSLARALGILLISDPGLNKKSLEGKLNQITGDIQLIHNGKAAAVKSDTTVLVGDTVISGSGSNVCLNYPDGSSLFIDANTEMSIKESRGREYIKPDGTANTAIEYLNLDVKKGTVFGGIATKQTSRENTHAQSQRALLASLDGIRLLGDVQKSQDMPWYNASQTQKVKVKVDMPWGVAAVRGTFLKVTVNLDGKCNISCLTGKVDVNGKDGGAQTLGGNQSGAIEPGGKTDQPTGMNAQDKQDFSRVQDFIVQSAMQIDRQKEAAIGIILEVPDKASEVQPEQKLQETLNIVLNALRTSGIELTSELKETLQEQLKNLPPETNSDQTRSSSSGNSQLQVITYGAAGTYGPASNAETISGDVIVNTGNVTLQNMQIRGRLFLAEGIGEGNVTLKNISVLGETQITGGGPNSVDLINCDLNKVIINKKNNQIRIIAQGTTSIGDTVLNSGARLEESSLSGSGSGFSSLNISSPLPAGAVIILAGNFATVNIDVPGAAVQVLNGSIGQVNFTAAATGAALYLATGTSVASLQINGPGVNVTGTGSINSAEINAAGVTMEQTPAHLKLADGITANVGSQVIVNPVNIAAIPGVTVPATDAAPVSTITETAQYTGTITWSPADNPYHGSRAYTATINLIPKAGYGFKGVAANFFTVAGANTTNAVNSGTVTAVFPATAAKTIDIAAIPDVTPPADGGTPVTTVENDQYTGTVTWTPADNPFVFGNTYTAHISLTPKTGYTLDGVGANFFTVAGSTTAANLANSGEVTATFPKVLSHDATVASPGNYYTIDNAANRIIQDQATIIPEVTVGSFLANLTKHAQASWKVVAKGTNLSNSAQFDAAAGKADADILLFDDKLAVKAEDGTVKVYDIFAVMSVITWAPESVPAPAYGYTKSNPYEDQHDYNFNICYGWVWGRYIYWPYDNVFNDGKLKIIAYDRVTGAAVGSWESSYFRYVKNISIDKNTHEVVFTCQGNVTLKKNWADLKITQ